MERNPFIFQIVGYQNSGKTTLAMKLIERWTKEGWRVGTIKHHGHGGRPQAGDEQKDTFRHRKAGAMVTGVEGEGMLHIHAAKEGWSLADILDLYKTFPLDCLLIEGYKREKYEKAVLIRSEADIPLLKELTNIVCVISWVSLDPAVYEAYPVFHIKDEQAYITWLTERVRGKREAAI